MFNNNLYSDFVANDIVTLAVHVASHTCMESGGVPSYLVKLYLYCNKITVLWGNLLIGYNSDNNV